MGSYSHNSFDGKSIAMYNPIFIKEHGFYKPERRLHVFQSNLLVSWAEREITEAFKKKRFCPPRYPMHVRYPPPMYNPPPGIPTLYFTFNAHGKINYHRRREQLMACIAYRMKIPKKYIHCPREKKRKKKKTAILIITGRAPGKFTFYEKEKVFRGGPFKFRGPFPVAEVTPFSCSLRALLLRADFLYFNPFPGKTLC